MHVLLEDGRLADAGSNEPRRGSIGDSSTGEDVAMSTRIASALLLSVAFSTVAPLSRLSAETVNQCIDRCFGNVGDVPGGHALRDACLQRCSQLNSFGAIAYSSATGHFGWDFGKTRAEAEQRALQQCGAELAKHGISTDDCETPDSWFRAPWCGSIARGRNGAYGIKTGSTAMEANSNALAECRTEGGVDCAVAEHMPQCVN